MGQSLRAGCAAMLLVVAASAGCGRHSGLDRAPAACTGGDPSARVGALRSALASAPAPVRLRDGTSIADCLAHDADSGDIQNVGSMLLTVTQQVIDSARGPHDARALTQLGYIDGAVKRGVSRSQVDGEIGRRIVQELGTVDTASPAFVRGRRAGAANG